MKPNRLHLFWFSVCCFMLTPAVQAQNLNEVAELAYQHDPQYLKARAQLHSTRETRSQAIAQLLPSLALSARSSRQRLDNKKVGFQGQGIQEYWDHSTSLELVQPLFRWDRWVQLSQSDNRIARMEALYAAAEQDLLIRVSEAYLNALLAGDSLQFSTSEQQALTRQLEQAQQRFEVGLIAKTDVLEAQAAFDLAHANEILAKTELDNSHEALREIIGEQTLQLTQLGPVLPLEAPEPGNAHEWVQIADLQNLTLIAEINQTEIARKTIDQMRSGHLPSLDIVASAAYQDNSSSFGLRGDTRGIGVQMNLPLFSGGAVQSRVRQAQFDYEAARHTLTKTRRAVKRQVMNAYRGVVASISQVTAFEAAVRSAQSALESAEAGMAVGTRTMVDVVTQQRNLYKAKRDRAESRYNYLNNRLKLSQAAGSLSRSDLEHINRLLTD